MCSCRCLRFDCGALLLQEAWFPLQDQFGKGFTGFTLFFALKPSNSAKWFEERRATRGVLPGRLWARFDHHVQCIDAIPDLSASRLNLYLGRQGTTRNNMTHLETLFFPNADAVLAGFGSDGHCSISRDPQILSISEALNRCHWFPMCTDRQTYAKVYWLQVSDQAGKCLRQGCARSRCMRLWKIGVSSASALVCCRVIWQFTAGNRLVMSGIFRQSPGLVTKISNSAPLRQPRPSLVQINLSYYLCLYIFRLRIASDCQTHLLMVVMFDVLHPVFFALFRWLLEALSSFSCSLPHSASCLWASTAQTSPQTSCRLEESPKAWTSKALRWATAIISTTGTEASAAETCRNIHVLSYFLHVLKHSRFLNLSGKICRRLLGVTLDALQWVSPCLQCSSVSYWAGTESLENLIRLVNQSSGECCPCHIAGTILFLLCQGIRFTWNLWWHLWGMQRRRKVQKSPEKSDFLLDTWATSFGQVMDHSHRIGRPRQNWVYRYRSNDGIHCRFSHAEYGDPTQNVAILRAQNRAIGRQPSAPAHLLVLMTSAIAWGSNYH